jgi:hypothetical protein
MQDDIKAILDEALEEAVALDKPSDTETIARKIFDGLFIKGWTLEKYRHQIEVTEQ